MPSGKFNFSLLNEMEQLPADAIRSIIAKLDTEDVLRLCQTSQRFMQLCKDPYFWREMVRREFPNIDEERPISDYYGLFLYLYGMHILNNSSFNRYLYNETLSPEEESDPRIIQLLESHSSPKYWGKISHKKDSDPRLVKVKEQYEKDRQRLINRYPPKGQRKGLDEHNLENELAELEDDYKDGLKYFRQQIYREKHDIAKEAEEYKNKLTALRKLISDERRDRALRFINNNRRTRPVRYTTDDDVSGLNGEYITSLAHYSHGEDLREGDLIGIHASEEQSNIPLGLTYVYRDDKGILNIQTNGRSFLPTVLQEHMKAKGLTDEDLVAIYHLPFSLPLTSEEESLRIVRVDRVLNPDSDSDEDSDEDEYDDGDEDNDD